MDEIKQEIHELREKTAQNRIRFMHTELQTCFTALEMARFKMSVANYEFASKELHVAEQGAEVIERLLREAPQHKAELAEKLSHLRASIASARSELPF